jgi:hypothetical protein
MKRLPLLFLLPFLCFGAAGPILLVGTNSNPFSLYVSEILKAEGLNMFDVLDVSAVSKPALAGYDVVILGETPLAAAQADTLAEYVKNGGNLIAMRPDKRLAGLLGLRDNGGTSANAYLQIDTTTPPGEGIVAEPIQFHGAADLYSLNGARGVARLFSNPSTPMSYPAVTLRTAIGQGGSAAAFTFDLAKSVVYTRQGNPAWAGQNRDANGPIRSNDLFFGNAAFDPEPDWVDRGRIAIPQADEQQRLLANLIEFMNRGRKPLPRFWYFPFRKKAVVIMTGDDHAHGGTAGRFDAFIENSPAGCNVAKWECVRGTSYVFPETPLADREAARYSARGFEVALHMNTNCADYTSATFEGFLDSGLATWKRKYPSLPAPVTNRTHCITWSDWSTQAEYEQKYGIRLDTNYYFYPAGWVTATPGFFTGSGIPMRFAKTDGAILDIYQATTQLTDESGQAYPAAINGLLDNAVGVRGFYGAFTANMHTDETPPISKWRKFLELYTVENSYVSSLKIVSAARKRNVPVVSARQMLDWLDGRNNSSFQSLEWSGNQLTFTVAAAERANGLTAMLPAVSPAGRLSEITRNGNSISYKTETIKGLSYALFDADSGSYQAAYRPESKTAWSWTIAGLAAALLAAAVIGRLSWQARVRLQAASEGTTH